MLYGHGGNIYETARRIGCDPSEIVDMSSNVNPLGPPPGLVDRLCERMEAIGRLPEVDARESTAAMAGFLGVDPGRLAAANGTTQIIYGLPVLLGTRRPLIVGPTYTDYASACDMAGLRPRVVCSRAEDGFRPDPERLEMELEDADTVFVCNPNNPTGSLIPPEELGRLCRRHPEVRFVVDESYFPFVAEENGGSLAGIGQKNLLVLLSDSKIFRIPGLRVGFLSATERTARRMRETTPPWSVNALAQEAVRILCDRPEETRRFVRSSARFLAEQRKDFTAALVDRAPSATVYPSHTSFLLIRLPEGLRAPGVCRRMAERRFLIRDCSNFEGLDERFVRVSLKTAETNRRAAAALGDILDAPRGA